MKTAFGFVAELVDIGHRPIFGGICLLARLFVWWRFFVFFGCLCSVAFCSFVVLVVFVCCVACLWVRFWFVFLYFVCFVI